jgi:hypothetical protein
MFNLTQINATNPQILIKSTSEVLLNGWLEEMILVFILLIAYMAFYFASQSNTKALVYSTFSVMIFSLLFLALQWITGTTFFIFVAIYGLSIVVAHNTPYG